MRVALLALALGATAPAIAQEAAAVDPRVDLLERRSLEQQQEIGRWRQQITAQGDQTARIAQLEAKNARLVAIGDELIAAYTKRYRRGLFAPFQFARTRFENEMQGVGDRVYENRADVPPRPAAAPTTDAPAAETPADATGSKEN